MRSAVVAYAFALCGCDVVFGLERPPIVPDAGAPGDWVTIAAGNATTCGIREGGRLWCWGYNRYGEVGVGRPEPEVSTPAQVLPSTVWKAVAIGYLHACGIQADDSLWCWGGNYDGQVGNGGVDIQREPAFVDPGPWASVAAGGDHSCGIKLDGTLWCWGRNNEGQVGNDTRMRQTRPVQVGAGIAWTQVTLGRRHSCALADGARSCWGNNASGELGLGDTATRQVPTPGMERPGEERWATLSAGDQVTCGVTGDTTGGALRCWGENRSGQLGDTTSTVQRSAPYPVATDAIDWIDVQVGSRFACGRRADRTLWCWGDTAPIVELPSAREPGAVDPGTPWDAIAVGRTHVCRLAPDRGLYCAGDGSAGARGDGTIGARTPVQVPGTWDRADAGGTTTCAIEAGGALSCWGDNWLGQVGDGSHLRRLAPVAIENGGWTSIAVGIEHGCGSRNGMMTCWGTNSSGSLGLAGTSRSATPVAVNPNVVDTLLDVSDHACATIGTSQLWCWGRNNYSEVGGAPSVIDVPTQIIAGGVNAWRGIATGADHTCVIAQDDKLRCVGANSYGQLGDTTTVARTTWANTTDSKPKQRIAGGTFHTCAIDRDDNTGTCWGRNSEGALGDGTLSSRADAVDIAGGHTWLALAGGDLHTCGVDTANELWCWGANYRGQLGDGTLEQRTVPTKVEGSNWAWVTAGEAHSCARKATGELWCWGDNRDGQLGTGTGWSSTFNLVPMP